MRIITVPLMAIMVLLSSSITCCGDNPMPYGDCCIKCGAYGICKEDMEPKEAEDAIGQCFAGKGFRAANIRHKGRFVEAEVYRDGRLVDKIILDRKTGRIRSTY